MKFTVSMMSGVIQEYSDRFEVDIAQNGWVMITEYEGPVAIRRIAYPPHLVCSVESALGD